MDKASKIVRFPTYIGSGDSEFRCGFVQVSHIAPDSGKACLMPDSKRKSDAQKSDIGPGPQKFTKYQG